VTQDRRLQLLLIAFCFGAFFEGAGGFGTPVAVTGAMLIGLGFSPLAASGLSLIANTAPVAYGALGTPITTLAKVTGIDVMLISSMVGRQMTIFAVIVPFWLLIAFCGWKNTLRIWPAALVAFVLRHSAADRLQYHGAGTGGRDRLGLLDRCPGAVPEGMAPARGIHLHRRHHGRCCSRSRWQNRTATQAWLFHR
jgi:hypothetical protein